MSRSTAEQSLDARAELFKALGHPVRLLILNLLDMKPRHGEELATILNLKPATISFHLAKLSNAGLVTSMKDQYYQTYALEKEKLGMVLGDIILLPQPGLSAQVEEDAYRKKVLKAFLRHGRLVSIPAQRKKRQIILETIVQEFEPERGYSELEVNQTLVEFHEDVATLRREMIADGLMTRSGGIYKRASG
jgi:ArsR family transcriptional regulator